MKGNKKLLVVAALILLITVTYTTYAIYKTAVSGTATISAAKWEVAFKNGETTLENNYEIEFSGSDCSGNPHVKDGVIAPGATCTKEIILSAGSTEVDVAYSASLGTITAEDSSGSEVSTTGANEFSGSLDPSSGSIAYNAAERTATLTLTVTWAGLDDSNTDTINNADTGLAGMTIKVPITLVAKQVVGS